MKIAAASVLAFASSAAAFSAPTMTFSLGKKKAAAAAPKPVSWCWGYKPLKQWIERDAYLVPLQTGAEFWKKYKRSTVLKVV